jgi:hypothetical protein
MGKLMCAAGALVITVCVTSTTAFADAPTTLRMRSSDVGSGDMLGLGLGLGLGAGGLAAMAAPPPPPVPGMETPSTGLAPWAWYALAGACIVGGLAIDLGVSSSSNGSWDVLDVAPIALYGVAGVIVYKETF